ncbi:MAG: SPASM domain-containing protein, partial [Clostridia bacterium]|nr:SPASM domain-containing protein [Clostridia bacterium]
YLRIHSVISALNIDHLCSFADFAGEHGVNEIAGALMAPYAFVPDFMRFSKDQIRSISNRIEELSEYAKRKGIALACWYANESAKVIQNLTNLHNMYPLSDAAGDSRAITCLGLWGQATVRPNGYVSVCCYSYKPILGNLHENTIEEIWHSKRAQALRKLVLEGEYIDAPCKGCDMGHPVFTKDLELTGSLDSFLEMTINAR